MNPHFIFNSLTSLQNLIVKNDTESANEYLGKFARLTRIALQQSTQNWVKLKDELKLLEHYIELEQIRFPDHFGYEIELKMDDTEIYVPPFLIQPFIENAILHGLAKKDEKIVQFSITDNGVGRNESSAGIKQNKSLGIRLIKERLQILLKMQAVKIIDLMDENKIAIGTKVVVYVPYKKKLDESINN
jgi:sensor histidine kinase YesM